ncbi:MAG: S8 family serine peptidase, partial [Acidobacteriota bacterium]
MRVEWGRIGGGRSWGRFARAVGALAVVASALPVAPAPAAAADPPAPPRPAISVVLGTDGFSPSTVVAVPGQQIEFTNTSGVEQQIVVGSAAAPTVDSGPIPDGGRFVATFDRAVTLGLTTAGDPPALGRLLITQPGLIGEPAALARPAIPDLAPPPTFESDLSPHPDYGLPTSRTTVLVLPTATATIAQVNDAIGAIGGSIVAGMPVLDTITVAIADAGDFSAWKPALDSLRAAPGIADAAPVWQGGTEVRPAPTNLGMAEDTWQGPLPTAPGQWGLRAIRAAQAWNTLSTAREAAVDVRTVVDTVVLDAGFGAHPDLPFASIVSSSGADDHGMVDAGIIGASYANAGGPGRTEGVVGVDPLSKLHGVEYDGGPKVTTPLLPGDPIRVHTVSEYSASFDWVLGQKRTGGQYPRLGVISASFGVAVFTGDSVTNWVNAVAGRTCNPGPADDPPDGIGGTVACSPVTQDVFVRDMRAVVTVYAQQVLSAAKVLDVVIVKSAGNANDEFCVNGVQILKCPNTLVQTNLELPAEATNEFIQARNALPGSEPLLVVGAVGPTGQGAFVAGAPITFSQGGPGVDLVAPGQGILSTTVNAPGTGRVQSFSGAFYERMSGTSQATPHVAGVVAYLRSAFNLSGTEAIDAIRSSTATVPFGGQLDMWAAVASIPRGRTALADQNDASVDGN